MHVTSFLKQLCKSKPNLSLLGERRHKFVKNSLVKMTKMAAMPIYGKNLLQNRKSNDLEMACNLGDSSSTKFV